MRSPHTKRLSETSASPPSESTAAMSVRARQAIMRVAVLGHAAAEPRRTTGRGSCCSRHTQRTGQPEAPPGLQPVAYWVAYASVQVVRRLVEAGAASTGHHTACLVVVLASHAMVVSALDGNGRCKSTYHSANLVPDCTFGALDCHAGADQANLAVDVGTRGRRHIDLAAGLVLHILDSFST